VLGLEKPDESGPLLPLHKTEMQRDVVNDPDTITPFDMPIPLTADGSDLVLAVCIETGTRHIASLTDSANNMWERALDGPHVSDINGNQRIEIWYVVNARSTDRLTIVEDVDRAIALGFTEWKGFGTSIPVVGFVANHGFSKEADTGDLDVGANALVIAGACYGTDNPTMQEVADWQLLHQFKKMKDGSSGQIVYLPSAIGTLRAKWRIEVTTDEHWSAGGAGLRLE
jgi:hypothetical protein